MTQDSTRKTALVTGASAGIGKAVAHQLALRGFDLVLTARRLDRLEEVSDEIRRAADVQVHVIRADLAQRTAPQKLFEAIAQRGLHIDCLINNAGYGLPGSYAQTRWKDQSDFIQVMVTAVAQLAHVFLPGMLERGYGRIMNVASVAGLVPGTPGHTLYGASKAFVIKFTESLAAEVGDQGVHVSALCPGFTFSEFHDVTRTRDKVSQLPSFMWMDAAQVAREGVDAMMGGQVVCVNGPWNRLLTGVMKHMPDGAAREIMRRRAKDYRNN